MSRIGKLPVSIPSGVDINLQDGEIVVKGKLGQLSQQVPDGISVAIEDNQVTVTRSSDSKNHRSLHGLIRSLIANMVMGVSDGFTKTMELNGVGYRAQVQGKKLVMSLGFSHPVEIEAPEGITFEVENNTTLHVKGHDKQQVGQVSANIRKLRKPEPYKGKGIKYIDEIIRRKAGKAAKAVG